MKPIEKLLEYRVQQVLPTVYDDSLSFYELVNKVVLKLNEVIDASNVYFAEDITLHVETLLTEWYTSGKLADIINETLMTEKASKSDLDELQAIVSNERQYKYSGTPEEYGAMGDGVTDDTAAIQECLNNHELTVFSSKAYGISRMLTLPRNHSIEGNSAQIKVLDNWTAHGLTASVSANTILFVEPRESIFLSERFMQTKHVKNLRILGKSGVDHVGLYLGMYDKTTLAQETTVNDSVFGMQFENISVEQARIGFYMNEVWQCKFIGCSTGVMTHAGLYFRGQSVNNFFVDCHFSTQGNGQAAVHVAGDTYNSVFKRPEGTTFTNCFIGYAGTGVRFYNGLAFSFVGCIIDLNSAMGVMLSDGNFVNFTDCYIQSESMAVITFEDFFTADNNCSVTFKGCNIVPAGANNGDVWIGLRQNGVIFNSCFFSRKIELLSGAVAMIKDSYFYGAETAEPKIIAQSGLVYPWVMSGLRKPVIM